MRWSIDSFAGKVLLGAAVVGCLASIGIYFIAVALHSGSASSTNAEAGTQYKFARQLQAGGAKTCLPRVEDLSRGSMQGVTEYDSAANWSSKAPDARILSSVIGLKYGNVPTVPYGFAGIFAAPAPDGKCDGFAVHVVPSPLSCADLQRSILERKGKILGNLAGVPLMQDVNSSQVALIPTAANACVLVDLRIAYSE